ncbi:WD40 repeat domain-containing protein [Micromonospora chalcea]|uniref:WD40 repeat domain-containing protein n=1 Tax=Micromonospora chalcea TaxID=1874 RepID=UPI00055B8412|nr:WD40 repeat domain-containing protein [Micromonospora purpureochromogenes]
MNQDRLRFDLADLAEEVTPVDLRDRALRTSRRLGIQRAAATSAAVLVVLAAATGTALAIRPNSQAPVPAGPSVTVTAPPVETTPTPSAEPSSTPSTSPSETTGGGPGEDVTFGRLVYGPSDLANAPSPTSTVRLQSWRPGDAPVRLLGLPYGPAQVNVSVSPDGKSVAWVETTGAVWVSALDGSGRRKLRDGVDDLCWSPVWLPNSQQLVVRLTAAGGGDPDTGVLDVSSGKFTRVTGLDGCHAVFAADGTLAFADGSDGTIVLTDRNGKNRRTVPGLGAKGSRYVSFDLSGLSPDGRRVALLRIDRNGTYGDAARELLVNAVLDTRTGAEVPLPLEGRQLRQVFFQPDGSMVVRVRSGDRYTVVLVDATGRKITERAEPSALRDMQIVSAGP